MFRINKLPVLVLLLVWELPQNILGMMVLIVMKRMQRITDIVKEEQRFYIETSRTGVSLGWFVFWTAAGNRFPQLTNDCRMHEYGHARQSRMLGPLYLIIVGIPSVSRVVYSRWYRSKYGCKWENYFKSFPENWADKLGGVTAQGRRT